MMPTNLRKDIPLEEIAKIISCDQSNLKLDPRLMISGVSAKSAPNFDFPWIFVAIEGAKIDGHLFVADAIKNGARFVIAQKNINCDVPVLLVKDSREALSRLVAKFFGDPSKYLKVIGITGTNGKTTTNWLIHHALNRLGAPSIRIGTLGYALPGIRSELSGDTGLTTPDAETVHGILAWGLSNGAQAAVLEVSSHALAQHRASEVEFDVGIFTNLTRDHLDFHGTLDRYKEAKWELFNILSSTKQKNPSKKGLAVVNIDDPIGREFCDRLNCMKGLSYVSFGRSLDARLRILSEQQSFEGSTLVYSLDGVEFTLRGRFIGAHNAENIAAVVGALFGLGFDIDAISRVIAELPAVPGRLEPVQLSDDFGVFVDYAHTPDALMRVLIALRPLTPGRLSVLFGCGGDRDKGKRPLMRQVATELADKVFITSDNPRTESPQDILRDITLGATADESRKIKIESDRRAAIGMALRELTKGDVLLVAGKGHEDYQILGDTKHPFLDAAVVKEQFDLLPR
jgi:UDP-N-acetylmuramoyl-L-alanyl-D-glutamate--2,6-diaminopimelate ligase